MRWQVGIGTTHCTLAWLSGHKQIDWQCVAQGQVFARRQSSGKNVALYYFLNATFSYYHLVANNALKYE
jgi:hypothetical protein